MKKIVLKKDGKPVKFFNSWMDAAVWVDSFSESEAYHMEHHKYTFSPISKARARWEWFKSLFS